MFNCGILLIVINPSDTEVQSGKSYDRRVDGFWVLDLKMFLTVEIFVARRLIAFNYSALM